MKTLPAGWSLARMGDLIELSPKVDAPDSSLAGFTPMQGLGTRYSESLKFEARPWGAIKKAYTHFADGDVLLAKITPCFENGKAGLAAGLPGGIGAGSSEFFVCRPDQRVLDRGYLLAWLSCDDFRSRAAVNMSGSVGHKRVPKDFLLDEELPLAPIAEQARLVAKLRAMFTRVDACRDRLARVAPLLKRFRQSVLAAATSGRLTDEWRADGSTESGADLLTELQNDHARSGGHARGNASKPTEEAHDLDTSGLPGSWAIATLLDLCEPGRPITYGILKPGPELDAGVPYVRVADFPGNRLRLDSIKKTSPEIDEQFKRARLRPGDLLLSIRGSVGRIIEIPGLLANANITQDTARLSISVRVSRRFVLLAILDEGAQRRMRAATRGVAVRGINIGDVRALQIPLPPLAEQAEIVRRVEVLFAFTDRLEARLAKAQAAADRLTPALLAKAFRGELVPQDPADEPAAELLKRLTAGRPAPAAKVRRPRAV